MIDTEPSHLWHWGTVAAFSVAALLEIVGFYCAQKGRFETRASRIPVKPRRYWWTRIWLTKDYQFRESVLISESAPVARGLGRLTLAIILIARFAAGQPAPWFNQF